MAKPEDILVVRLAWCSSPADPRHVIAGQVPEGIHA